MGIDAKDIIRYILNGISILGTKEIIISTILVLIGFPAFKWVHKKLKSA